MDLINELRQKDIKMNGMMGMNNLKNGAATGKPEMPPLCERAEKIERESEILKDVLQNLYVELENGPGGPVPGHTDGQLRASKPLGLYLDETFVNIQDAQKIAAEIRGKILGW